MHSLYECPLCVGSHWFQVAAPEVSQKGESEVVEDYDKLANDLESASPLEIMDKALQELGNDMAIAFSGVKDVVLMEYAQLTSRPFRVFNMDTRRWTWSQVDVGGPMARKWRCSKDGYPGSKYCGCHMHRGRNYSRKPVES